MTWTRLSDDFYDRPEMLSVSRDARLLHSEAMVWCNRMTTNGKIPPAALRRISDAEDIPALVDELSAAGIWTATEDGQWQLDWSDQESAEEVHARAEYRAATQKRYRERKARHERGDHGACDPRFCKSAVTGNATSNKHGYETPSRPVPSRRDRGQGADRHGAGAPAGRAKRDDLDFTSQRQLLIERGITTQDVVVALAYDLTNVARVVDAAESLYEKHGVKDKETKDLLLLQAADDLHPGAVARAIEKRWPIHHGDLEEAS